MALEIKILDYGDIELESSFSCSVATVGARAVC